MSQPFEELYAWIEKQIPVGWVGLKHRWLELDGEHRTRYWVLYNNSGLVDGSTQIEPVMRLILMGRQLDRDINGLTQLASDIIEQAACEDDFTTGELALIDPLQWVSPVGFTEENRPFVELTFRTIIK